jgi:hypothetical protein
MLSGNQVSLNAAVCPVVSDKAHPSTIAGLEADGVLLALEAENYLKRPGSIVSRMTTGRWCYSGLLMNLCRYL